MKEIKTFVLAYSRAEYFDVESIEYLNSVLDRYEDDLVRDIELFNSLFNIFAPNDLHSLQVGVPGYLQLEARLQSIATRVRKGRLVA